MADALYGALGAGRTCGALEQAHGPCQRDAEQQGHHKADLVDGQAQHASYLCFPAHHRDGVVARCHKALQSSQAVRDIC